MKLFINVGGKGTRLGSLTQDVPKPMIPIHGKPVLEYLVMWAKANGMTDIVMLSGHLHEVIEDYFGDGEKFGVKISYSVESKPLGSGGAVRNARAYVDGTCCLISGDVICNINLSKMMKSHRTSKGAVMTILVRESDHPHDSDILKVDDNNRVVKFIGKKEDHTGSGNLANAGLFIIEPEVFDFMDDECFTFETYLFPKLLDAGMYLNTYIANEYFFDMGTPERLEKAKKILQERFRN
jgi:NDP-sugar pyrophosphorylase family protein